MPKLLRMIVRTPAAVSVAAILGLSLFVPITKAQQYDPNLYSGLRWRMIGPFRAGRVNAVSGARVSHPQQRPIVTAV